MFLESISVLYPPCISRSRALTSQFNCSRNNKMCSVCNELSLKYVEMTAVEMSNDCCNLLDQMQKIAGEELFWLFESRYHSL